MKFSLSLLPALPPQKRLGTQKRYPFGSKGQTHRSPMNIQFEMSHNFPFVVLLKSYANVAKKIKPQWKPGNLFSRKHADSLVKSYISGPLSWKTEHHRTHWDKIYFQVNKQKVMKPGNKLHPKCMLQFIKLLINSCECKYDCIPNGSFLEPGSAHGISVWSSVHITELLPREPRDLIIFEKLP